MRSRLAVAALAAALAVTGAGCVNDDPTRSTPAGEGPRLQERRTATLVLDFLPNAVHAGIYRAVAAGYYEDNNVDLEILKPSQTSDTLKLIDAGEADIGLADSVDVMQQIDRGRDVQAVMAVVQRPLGGLITRREDRLTPERLAGRRVGISGVPSDEAVLETIARGSGVDPSGVETVTIGFGGVQNLAAGSIDAFIGYYPADGTQAAAAGTPVRSFPFDEHGGPRYPGLVAYASGKRIRGDGALLRAVIDATVRGYEDVLRRPATGVSALLDQNRDLERELTTDQLDAYLPLFGDRAPRFGTLRERDLAALSAFLVRSGLIENPVASGRFATSRLLPTP
jgi:NitT/TauT family transport system substrate-binding protein/putative hydroxymethylpyrimidine transport system substrate-binding protein